METAADNFRASSPLTVSPEMSQGTPSSVSSGPMSLLGRSSLSSSTRQIANDNSTFSSHEIRSQIHQIVADTVAEVRDQLLQLNSSSNTSTNPHITQSQGRDRSRQIVPLLQRNIREESPDIQLENHFTTVQALDLDMESSDNESLPSITTALRSGLSSDHVQQAGNLIVNSL